jgi:hypothetical protein
MNLVPTPFQREVACRFGLVPNFFVAEPDAPEIVERLWAFAVLAYFDNPIPSLFTLRLSLAILRGTLLYHPPLCVFARLWTLGRRSYCRRSVRGASAAIVIKVNALGAGSKMLPKHLRQVRPAPTGRRPRANWKTSYSARRRLFSLREAVPIRLAQPSATS